MPVAKTREGGANTAGFDRSATVFDYFNLAGDSRIIVSEPDEIEAHATSLLEQLQRSHEEVVSRKQRALPPSELFADWETIKGRLNQGTALVALRCRRSR